MSENVQRRNTGPWHRRLMQYIGLAYNDDGTWSPMRLQSARGRKVVSELKAKEQPKND